MKNRLILAGAAVVLLTGLAARAEVTVNFEHKSVEGSPDFKFKSVPAISTNDAATNAKFTIVSGERDMAGGGLDKLHDGKPPLAEDDPDNNFFFNAGTEGGRLQVDLGGVITIKQVNTYSCHVSTRAPQVYKLYASDGTAKDFNAAPKTGTDPEKCGWKLIAKVDTRPKSSEGGQCGVSISNADGALGKYRYLLFDISRTEADDDYGNTFYSEIDVIEQK